MSTNVDRNEMKKLFKEFGKKYTFGLGEFLEYKKEELNVWSSLSFIYNKEETINNSIIKYQNKD